MPGHSSRGDGFSAWVRHPVIWARALIIVAVLAAYGNSLGGALVLDDTITITANPSIQGPWSLARALSPPAASTLGGRPLANLSFALNHLLGGNDVRSYHLVNLAIHLLAALALFEIIRLTPASSEDHSRGDPRASSLPLAFCIALLWAVHPLLTGSVTYISQRTESLMGLCYLLTLLGFIRGVRGSSPRWLGFSVALCAAGMAVKEIMVTAPVIVLLYDRTFFARSFLDALRQRWRYYVGLAATWFLLGYLMSGGLGQRSVGYGLGVSWLDYALTQCDAVVTYLRLGWWPHPLILDYGPVYVHEWRTVAPQLLLLLAVLGGTLVTLVRWPRWGFLAAWFFITLAPTSSVVPVALQPIAENRTYLPLMAVVALSVLILRCWVSRLLPAVCVLVAVVLAVATHLRNESYRSEPILLVDTLEKRPQNPRAHFNYGNFLAGVGRYAEACEHYRAAVQLQPNYPEAYNNYGNTLLQLAQPAPALEQFERSLALRPKSAATHLNRATTLLQLGRNGEALAEFRQAVSLDPANPALRLAYGGSLLRLQQPAEALVQLAEGVRQEPTNPGLLDSYALALLQTGDPTAALAQWSRAVERAPDAPEIRSNYANALYTLGRMDAAAAQYAAILQRNPDATTIQVAYANALFALGRHDEAMTQYERAIRLKPDFPDAHYHYGVALLNTGQIPHAVTQLEQAVQLRPASAQGHNTLGAALLRLNQPAAAAAQFEEALRLNPQYDDARQNLARLRRGSSEP